MSSKNITELTADEQAIPAVWRQAFRPFFLAGCLFSMVAVAAWIAALSGYLSFSPHGSIVFWHGHEMLFGFVCAIIVGFLLTAVQSWTGLRATHGKMLVVLFLVWLSGRVLMAFPGLVPEWLVPGWMVALVDISFLPMATILVARLVVEAKSYRNYQFIPILLLITLANILTHASVILHKPALFAWGIYAAIMLGSLLMTVIGGRVIPLFTAAGVSTQPVIAKRWLERMVLISTWLIVLGFLSDSISNLPNWFVVATFLVASFSHAYRLIRWRGWITFAHPLVWSLHVAYSFIPISFGLFALHYAGVNVSSSTALHSITVGAMGTLILTMVARVSLGHSGRPLQIRGGMKVAFSFIVIAAVTRVLVGLYPSSYTSDGYIVSASLWVLAYGTYCITYFKVLTTPRPDGRLG